nr:MAG TPA: hypothetical protein [Bacteriophage sp.]
MVQKPWQHLIYHHKLNPLFQLYFLYHQYIQIFLVKKHFLYLQ